MWNGLQRETEEARKALRLQTYRTRVTAKASAKASASFVDTLRRVPKGVLPFATLRRRAPERDGKRERRERGRREQARGRGDVCRRRGTQVVADGGLVM